MSEVRAERPERDPGAAALSGDPDDGRQESLNQRLDRNWLEILQELRVTQTGTQILTGFLLSIAFQPKFGDLTRFQERVYLVLVVIAVLTTALALAPVSLHRSLFRRRAKLVVVRVGHLILRLVLLGVGLVLVGTVLLVFDVVLGRGTALAVAGAVALVLVALGLLPVLLRRAPSPHAERPGNARADS